ncbi:MAG: FumA C-terminus/TtdB family hydratase beta subunit [Oscillospiraceae bacterium]|nr:FumA C-terminus/TtdB family hydratase beta subunit [Oscillospiraceae bacterium]
MHRTGAIAISVSELRSAISEMWAGDRILLSGDIYTARDAAHIELFRLLDEGKPLPFDIRGAVIYYAGPTPGGDNRPVGSCGPTTSCRMDAFAPRLYDMGLLATIGKGERSAAVHESIVKNAAVYLCAVGGAGALIAKHIVSAEEIAFNDLGCESIKRLTVDSLPLTVGIDSYGGVVFNAYTRGR